MLKKFALCFFAALFSFCTYLTVLQLVGNFHEVVPGEFYRSAQLTDKEFEGYIKKYNIQSIINLRGNNAGNTWYDEEIATAKKMHVAHMDFRMSTKRELSVDESNALITLMRNAPKPLLIHCRGGSDRSGLAAALYLGAIEKKGEFWSSLQLSPIYGHIPYRIIGAPAMTTSFGKMKPQFGFGM